MKCRIIDLGVVAGVHGDLFDDLGLIDGCPWKGDFELIFKVECSFEKGAGLIGVLDVDCGFDLERVVAFVFLGVASEEPEIAFIVQASGIAGAVPGFPVDFDLGFGVSPTIEIAL